MFLLQINKKVSQPQFLKIKQLKFLKFKLKNQLNVLKKTKDTFCVTSIKPQSSELKKTIKYIVGISFSNTNVRIYVTDIKGRLKFSISAGLLGLYKKQKNRKPSLVVKLIQLLKINSIFVQNSLVALHLRNFTKFFLFPTINSLKNHFNIGLIKVFNAHPYNGCRPRKLKRKKHRKPVFSR